MNATTQPIAPTTEEEALEILALADFAFLWEDKGLFGDASPVSMFNLTKAIPGHCKGSTVSRATLLAHVRSKKLSTGRTQ